MKPQMSAALLKRDQKHGSSEPSDQCLQRASLIAPDCVEKRDPHINQT